MLGECNNRNTYANIEAFDQHLNGILDGRIQMPDHQIGDPQLSPEEDFYTAFHDPTELKFSDSNFWVSKNIVLNLSSAVAMHLAKA